MRFVSFGTLLTVLFATSGVAADALQPYVSVQSISYSQPIAIASMINDEWSTPFKDGDSALTYNKAELGVAWHGWQLGVLTRYDYLVSFSDETAQGYYLANNHLPLETGRVYPLNIEVQSQYSRGLRLGFQHKLTSSFNAGLAVSYLQGITLMEGELSGSAQVIGEKDYDFQFDVDYVYSKDVLFEREVKAPQGYGYSLDLKLDWQPTKRFAGQLTVIDLLGEIKWINAPYTTATGSSDTKTYDEDGYVRYKAVGSGLESNKDFIQILPRKIFAAAQYQWSRELELLAEFQDLDIEQFTSLGAGWRLWRHISLQGLYNISAQALTLRFQQKPQLLFEIGSDSWNLDHARYLVFHFSYNVSF
jgi:hypothetical protein